MAKHSKDLEDEVAVLNELLALETEKDIRAFIKGEERESVLEAAAERINEILKSPRPGGERAEGEGAASQDGTTKQGQEPGPLTQETREFKGSGVEGTKSQGPLAGEDVIDALDEAAEKKADEIVRLSAAEEASDAQKQADTRKEKNYVTGEDVIARMRATGKKI